MGEDLVDDHAVVGAETGGAGSAAVFRAGTPGAGIGVIGRGRIDQFQGRTVAVGAAGPVAAVAVGDRGDGGARGVAQFDGFAAVAQLPAEDADDADGGIGVADAERVGVLDDDGVGAVGEDEGGEGGGNAVLELEAGQVQRGVAGVVELDELEGLGIGEAGGGFGGGEVVGIVVQFGDDEIEGGAADIDGGGVIDYFVDLLAVLFPSISAVAITLIWKFRGLVISVIPITIIIATIINKAANTNDL